MAVRVAAVAAACLLGVVVLFQVALVFGAPWGAYTQGGSVHGPLPASGRAVAALSAGLLMLMAGAVLARVGLGPMRSAPRRLVTVLAWFTAAYSVVGVLLNLATPSAKERLLWAPVTGLLAVLVLVAVIGTRGPRTLEEASRSGGRGGLRHVEESPDSTGQDGG